MHRIAFAILFVATSARADDFDPLDPTGWPKNLSVEDMRELPECTQPLPHTPGADVTCRPPLERGPVQWGLGFDWTTGGVTGTVPTLGGMHLFGVELDFALSRGWQAGARYELGGAALPSPMPGVDGGMALTQHFLSELKYRVFTDEVARDAWVLGIGGGLALRGDELGGTAPMLRLSIAREVGAFVGRATTADAQLELAVEHSQTGDARLDAVLASVRIGVEDNVRAPLGLGHPAPTTNGNAYSFDVFASFFLGFGMSYEVPVASHLRLVTSGNFMFDLTSDQMLHGFDGAQWAGLFGPRLQGSLFYLQAQAGGAWVGKDPEAELRAIGQGELGVRGFVGCTSAVDIGAWVRDDLETGDVTAGGLMLRVVSGARESEWRGRCGGGGLVLASPPPPPSFGPPSPRPEFVPPPDVAVTVPDVAVEAHAKVDVEVEAHAKVDVEVKPIVVDVVLGVAIPGLSIRLDPRLLPLDRLRGAVRVEVELTGPADAIPSFQAQLQGTLSRSGLRVDAITSAPDDSSSVHARFTIYPPGWHP